MKKIALIIPNNLWVSPYISIYTRLFDELSVKYDIISWNREGREETGIQFNYKEKNRRQVAIFWSYIKYANYLIKTIKKNGYDKLVVFTPQLSIFLSIFLEKCYKGRYVFDYRDLSLEQKPLFAKKFRMVLSNSYANVISSPGFKSYLPSGYDFVVSHNFNTAIVKKAIADKARPFVGEDIPVLTIGALRTDMNPQVIDALGNVTGYHLSFVGKGMAAESLENYAKSKGYGNVEFTGYYKKEDEPDIYQRHAIVNIVYPLIPSHISALSNRFYNSLIYKRPMLVTKGTIQGDYAKEYSVGLTIDNCENLKDKIADYCKELDFEDYAQRCNKLLGALLEENEKFEATIRDFAERV